VINDPGADQTAVRQPLLAVFQVAGPTAPGAPAATPGPAPTNVALAGAINATCTQNNYYHPDHFEVRFAASAGTVGWWDVDPPLVLDIRFSIDNGQSWVSQIVGEVDDIDFDLETGTTRMEGRDLSARLAEAKTQETFVNQTSSEVAATLAARHGFGTNIAATTTLVGRFYEADHVKVTLDQFSKTTTEWDLLVYLAQREQFDVYMTGTALNFQPITLPNANPYGLVWTPPAPVPRFNVTGTHLKRSLTIAKDVQVSVTSWSQQGRAFTKTTKAAGTKSKGGPPQKYVFVIPNLDEATAQARANQLAIDITKHERVLDVPMPGELVLTPRNMVALSGTGTSFDQAYFIDSITREVSFGGGFTQSLRCKSSSPRTQTQL
jgi:phage protein D